MFVNLYWEPQVGLAFRDHNFNYFLQFLTRVTEASVVSALADRYETNFWDPYFAETFEFTLSSGACESFLRSHPALPVNTRDYYLSKLFQFLKLSIDEVLKLLTESVDDPLGVRKRELHRLIEEALDDIDDSLIAHLPYFDWFTFQYNILQAKDPTRFEVLLSGSSLRTYLKTERIEHPSSKTPERKGLHRRRQRLLDAFLAVVPDATFAQVYRAKRVDERDFRRWRGGELADKSTISQRLETGFKEAIDKASESRSL